MATASGRRHSFYLSTSSVLHPTNAIPLDDISGRLAPRNGQDSFQEITK
jgi:hypothetical protein